VHARPAGFYASYYATLNFSFDAPARAGLRRFFEELRSLGAIAGIPPVEPEAFVVHH
jgi:predicted solute-binding protein